MQIDLIRLLIDFGLLVLIWMVQLVVYPSFAFYSKKELINWHQLYTPRITMMVFPLMAGQLLTGIFQLAKGQSLFSIISIIVITTMWLLTFFIFVPIHNKITSEEVDDEICTKLVKYNWLRTAGWSFLFIWNFLQYYFR